MSYPLSELIDMPALQKLMEALHRATGINHALIDNDSKVLTAAGWSKVCTDYHRAHPDTCRQCLQSDQYILGHLHDAPYVGYDCPNGLVDYATPVYIEGRHVANVFTGQMLHGAPDLAFFARQAERYGFDAPGYLGAVREVPVVPRERMPAIMAFLVGLAEMLGQQGLMRRRQMEAQAQLSELNEDLVRRVRERTVELSETNRQLQRAIVVHEQAALALAQEKQFSDDTINCMPGIFYLIDRHGALIRCNQRFCEVTGYSQAEVGGMLARKFFDDEDGARIEARIGEVFACGEASIEAALLTRDGRRLPYYFSGRRTGSGDDPYMVGLGINIAARKRAEEKIQYMAHFDALTGLPNRSQLAERVAFALTLAQRSGEPAAVMFLDIDHFKDINDTLGHSAGDALLVQLAQRLRQLLRNADTVARLGGDEFIFLLPSVDAAGAAEVAQKLLAAIAVPYRIEHHDLNVTGSIGIALYPADGDDFETLCKRADVAMYRAKQEGRHGYRFFTGEMQARSARHLELVNALRQALAREQMRVHYQPQVAMRGERVIGAEALVRWTHPELGPVAPSEFIPAAEECGLILPIGEWVLRQAVRQAVQWRRDGIAPLVMAVNLSAVQFRHPNLPALVSRILEEEGLEPACLELELTEGVSMADPQAAIATMNNLHARGVRMSIDDFGTGYSSLGHLKKFKVYKLKIDQSFVRDIGTDPEDRAIVSAIIQMAKSLGLQTIAEGVETDGQRAFLREQECDEMQGYLYSRPLSPEQFAAYARDRAQAGEM